MHPSLQRSGGLTPGRTLAERYEILDVRATDSFTSACRARDLLSSQELTVFCFHAGAAPGLRVLDQFRRDAGCLRTVHHPNVARVIDAGDDGPLFYVAIEPADGRLLSDRLRVSPRLQPNEAADLLEGLARGLAALHSAGVAHLDVRPSRILIAPGVLKLLPFDAERDVRQLRISDAASRFAYSAPEHLLGRGASYPADVYSAAAVAFEVLTGAPPHAGMALHLRAFSAPPPIPGAHPALAQLLEQCLQPDPASRFQNAAALAEACAILRRPAATAPAQPTLSDLLRDEPQDPAAIVPLILAVCPVLRRIHEQGKAHRDPAPSNVMLTKNGGVEMPSSDPAPPNATMMVDDPKYAAPEVLLSRLTAGGTAHILADIYVLGFCTYELLAGRLQFNRQFDGPDGPGEHLAWMGWHADPAKQLPPLRELAPQAPQPLCELIDRMIRKNPAERVQSLEDVEKGLRHLGVRLEDTQEFEVKAFVQPPPPKRKSRAGWFWTLALLLLIACAVGGWLVLRSFGLEERGFEAAFRDASAALTARFTGEAGEAVSPGVPPPVISTASGPMVLVPAGEFTMGGDTVPNESPQRRLTLPAYYLDRFEVTNGAYLQFCDRTQRPRPQAPAWAADYFTRATHPVLNVTWDDARAFCAGAGKRLPSEAEWEKAARGDPRPPAEWRNWTAAGLANLGSGGRGMPAPVGAYGGDLSPFGIADMAGNVHEWTADDYALYPGNGAALPPSPPSKVVRGGSYAIGAAGLSPSWRASLTPDMSGRQDLPVGFRCAADVAAGIALAGR